MSSRLSAWCLLFFLLDPHMLSASETGVKIENPIFDFGQIPAGESRRFETKIWNRSSTEVSIARIQTGCTCTSVSLSTMKIPVDGAADVFIGIQSGKAVGMVREIVIIETENGEKGLIEVSGRIVDAFVAEPGIVNFGSVVWNENYSQEAVIKSSRQISQVAKMEVLPHHSSIACSILDTFSTGSILRVQLIDPPPGYFRQLIKIKIIHSSDEVFQMALPVHADVAGPLSCDTPCIYLGKVNIARDRYVTRQLIVNMNGIGRSEVGKIQVNNLPHKITVKEDSQRLFCDVQLDLEGREGFINDLLIFETNDKKFALKIPIIVYCDSF